MTPSDPSVASAPIVDAGEACFHPGSLEAFPGIRRRRLQRLQHEVRHAVRGSQDSRSRSVRRTRTHGRE